MFSSSKLQRMPVSVIFENLKAGANVEEKRRL
jgi:uncharacterized protein (DUF433 family)